MTSSKFTKTNIWLPTLIIAILLMVVFPLRNKLNDNIRPLEARISDLDTQIKTLPKKERFVLEKEKISLEKDRITFKNNNYGLMIQSLGGIFFVVTAFLTWRNVITAEANLEATEEKMVTERFSKAVELLASEKLEMRLGGIYALERVAKDSEKDYWQVMEVLTAFIRQNKTIKSEAKPYKTNKIIVSYKDVESPDDETDQNYFKENEADHIDEYEDEYGYYKSFTSPNEDYIHPIEVDIQAVLTVLGRREELNKNHQRQILDLQRTDLRGAILAGNFTNVNFLNVNLQYAVIIEKADFSKSLGLNCPQIKRAKHWQKGIYSRELEENLNISNTKFIDKSELEN